MSFYLEGPRLGSLFCIGAVVVEVVGTFCSLMRVNPLARLGQTDLSQGLYPLGMLHPGLGAYGEGCLSFFLGASGVPCIGRAPALSSGCICTALRL